MTPKLGLATVMLLLSMYLQLEFLLVKKNYNRALLSWILTGLAWALIY